VEKLSQEEAGTRGRGRVAFLTLMRWGLGNTGGEGREKCTGIPGKSPSQGAAPAKALRGGLESCRTRQAAGVAGPECGR
jgi:hypothetical protein